MLTRLLKHHCRIVNRFDMDPPCHPSDHDWTPCRECRRSLKFTAAIYCARFALILIPAIIIGPNHKLTVILGCIGIIFAAVARILFTQIEKADKQHQVALHIDEDNSF